MSHAVVKDQKTDNKPGIGIYWGTFDPPTLAHADIIAKSIAQFKLSKLIVVVNDNSTTGKTYKIPGKVRANMIRRMFYQSPLKGSIVVLCQTDKFSLTYAKVKEIYSRKVYSIVGQDSFEYYGKKCAGYDQVIVVPRGNNHQKLQEKIAEYQLTNISVLTTDPKFLHVSSTLVRESVGAASDQKQNAFITYTHPKVKEFIYRYGFLTGNYNTAQHHVAANTIQHAWKKFNLKKQSAAAIVNPLATPQKSDIKLTCN